MATVNDAEIGYYDFQNSYQLQRRQMEQLLGQRLSGEAIERRLRDQTLERMVNDEVVLQTTLAAGLRVGDGQLAESIRTLPAFRGESGFSQDIYDSFLRTRGMTSQRFEFDLRRSLLTEQLTGAVRSADFITDAQAEQLWQIANRVRRYRAVTIDAAKMDVPEPDDEAVKDWFEAHQDEYQNPLRLKIAYLTLDRAALAAEIAVDDDELRALYESSKQNYRTAEQREARHILVKLDSDADAAAVAAAEEKINALRARITGGEDFAAVAREASDDPGSAANGGGLGMFGRGVMDPAFEEAAFGLAQDAVSEPVRSSFGWHLIEVTAVSAEKLRTFDEVREDLKRNYQNSQAEQIFAERVERLSNLAFEHPESLEVAAEELGLRPTSSEFFSRASGAGDAVTASPAVREAAFNPDVMDDGNNSEMVEIAPGRVAVLRVTEREDARAMTLEEATPRIKNTLKTDARMSAAANLGERILESLRGGDALETVASEYGQSFSEVAEASPASPGALAADSRRSLFAMPPPAEGELAFAGVALPGVGFQVLVLEGIAAPQSDGEQAKRVAQTRRTAESGLANAAFAAVLKGLRARADVQVFEDRLSAETP